MLFHNSIEMDRGVCGDMVDHIDQKLPCYLLLLATNILETSFTPFMWLAPISRWPPMPLPLTAGSCTDGWTVVGGSCSNNGTNHSVHYITMGQACNNMAISTYTG